MWCELIHMASKDKKKNEPKDNHIHIKIDKMG